MHLLALKNYHKVILPTIIICFLLLISSGFAQSMKSKRVINLASEYIRLEGQNKIDSLSKIIYDFESQENLNPLENQVLYLCKGNLNNKIEKFDLALKFYKQSISYNTTNPESKKSYIVALAFIADLYFTKQNYVDAKKYAFLAKKYITEEFYYEYISIYSIIGYAFYKENNNVEAIRFLKIAEQIIKKNEDTCKLPEVQMKMAEVYDAMDQFDEAIKLVDNCIYIGKECELLMTEKNARITKNRILKKHDKLQAIVNEKDSISRIDEKLNIKQRNKKIDELETKYKTKIKEQQNASLLNINKEKEARINKQNLLLTFIIIGFLLVSVLAFLIYKSSKKRVEINKKLEAQNAIIENNNKELERLNLLNQKIFSVISHDFKGSIAALKIFLANETFANKEFDKHEIFIQDFRSQIENSEKVLFNLLDWAKTELIANNNQPESIDITTLLNQVIAEFKSEIKAKNLTIINKIDNHSSTIFNKSVLQIALRNALSNAIKYSYDGSMIELYTKDNIIFVRDYGDGIPADKLKLLFNKNLNSSIGTQLESGFGIGLYFCQELMIKNNGFLTAQNAPDGGFILGINLEIKENH